MNLHSFNTGDVNVQNCTCGSQPDVRQTFDDTTFYYYLQCPECGNKTAYVHKVLIDAAIRWNEYISEKQ